MFRADDAITQGGIGGLGSPFYICALTLENGRITRWTDEPLKLHVGLLRSPSTTHSKVGLSSDHRTDTSTLF